MAIVACGLGRAAPADPRVDCMSRILDEVIWRMLLMSVTRLQAMARLDLIVLIILEPTWADLFENRSAVLVRPSNWQELQ